MAGTWTRYMMIAVATLVLVLLMSLMLAPIIGSPRDEMSFVHSYSLTQRIVSVINTLSASPQDETAIIELNPIKCNITFDTDYNYIESEVDFLSKNSYGLFVFKDIELDPPDTDYIECDPIAKKYVLIIKSGKKITVKDVSFSDDDCNTICNNLGYPVDSCLSVSGVGHICLPAIGLIIPSRCFYNFVDTKIVASNCNTEETCFCGNVDSPCDCWDIGGGDVCTDIGCSPCPAGCNCVGICAGTVYPNSCCGVDCGLGECCC